MVQLVKRRKYPEGNRKTEYIGTITFTTFRWKDEAVLLAFQPYKGLLKKGRFNIRV